MTNAKKTKPTVAVATLGCKVNQCESASFQENFADRGCTGVSINDPADIYVINTCAVTAKAAAQSRQLIRRAQRANPDARVIVTGCYAQVDPEKIREVLTGPGCIIGNANKHQLVEAALTPESSCGHRPDKKIFSDISLQREISLLPVRRFSGKTRAFLKVQDGCNSFCTYCIVPYARGRSRSLPLETVLEQAVGYAKEGHRETVVTGIHVGHYGLDLDPPTTLLELLRELVRVTPGIRYRLSSLEPVEISSKLLEFMAGTDNFMPHLHIPLQSGSNAILRKMNRRYTAEKFEKEVELCMKMVPEAAVGVDVLVGFPGETDEDFLQTYELISRLPVSYLHVFPYSRRDGTPAAKMKEQVPAEIKDERVAQLRKLDHKKRKAFYSGRIGKVHQILVESESSADGLYKGFTENYIPVHFRAGPEDTNRVLPVRLEKLAEKYVIGTLVAA